MSISHRISGVVLSVAMVLFSAWIISAAYAPDYYDTLSSLAASPVGQLGLFGITLCLYYHLCSGIRHLFWDVGYGFDIKTVYRTGYFTIFATVILTVITWYAIKLGR